MGILYLELTLVDLYVLIGLKNTKNFLLHCLVFCWLCDICGHAVMGSVRGILPVWSVQSIMIRCDIYDRGSVLDCSVQAVCMN